MTALSPRAAALAAALLSTALAPAAASADGLPVLGIDVGATGVVARSGNARYVTLTTPSGTLAARIDPRGARLSSSTLLHGRFTIPAVAYDGTASGLSADGRRLVLIEPRGRFPRATTRFLVLDTRRLTRLATIELKGDFSFDAISPDGRRMYLVQYIDPLDPSRYVVRAYDLQGSRLGAAIRDPIEPDEDMRGAPQTRVTSPDGRWAYTLYDGGGGTPFVHALDTSRGVARCIDLPRLTVKNLLSVRLRATGTALSLSHARSRVATIDVRTFRVVWR